MCVGVFVFVFVFGLFVLFCLFKNVRARASRRLLRMITF